MAAGPDLHHAIESFSTWLRVERNLSPRTRDAYVYDLQRFHGWLLGGDEEAKGYALRRITADHLSSYISHIRQDLGYEPATTGRVLSALRTFFGWCVEERLLDENPAADFSRPKLARKLPVYLVPHEVQKLFDAPDVSTARGRRDRAILLTLAYCGLRLQELVGLNTIDIDFSRSTVRVFGKGRKERLVPLNEDVEGALLMMLEDPERNAAPGEKAVFLNRHGRRMSGRSVQYLVDDYAKRAGIDRRTISPHKLRHTFATLLHHRDVDLVDIQALMGHASLASTQVYTHTDTRRLQSAIDRLDMPE